MGSVLPPLLEDPNQGVIDRHGRAVFSRSERFHASISAATITTHDPHSPHAGLSKRHWAPVELSTGMIDFSVPNG